MRDYGEVLLPSIEQLPKLIQDKLSSLSSEDAAGVLRLAQQTLPHIDLRAVIL